MIKKRAFLGILFTAALLLATGCVRESNDANKHFNPADYPDPEAAAQPEAVEYDSNFDLSNVETEAATDLKGTCWLFEESKSVPISYGSGSGTGTGTGTGTGSGEGTGNGNGSSEESLYEFSKVKTGVTGTSTDNVTEEKPYIAFDKDDNFYYYGKQVTISTYQGTWEEVQVNKVLKSTGEVVSTYTEKQFGDNKTLVGTNVSYKPVYIGTYAKVKNSKKFIVEFIGISKTAGWSLADGGNAVTGTESDGYVNNRSAKSYGIIDKDKVSSVTYSYKKDDKTLNFYEATEATRYMQYTWKSIDYKNDMDSPSYDIANHNLLAGKLFWCEGDNGIRAFYQFNDNGESYQGTINTTKTKNYLSAAFPKAWILRNASNNSIDIFFGEERVYLKELNATGFSFAGYPKNAILITIDGKLEQATSFRLVNADDVKGLTLYCTKKGTFFKPFPPILAPGLKDGTLPIGKGIDKYKTDIEWCYQGASFEDTENGIKLTFSWNDKEASYKFEDAEGRFFTIDNITPFSFTAKGYGNNTANLGISVTDNKDGTIIIEYKETLYGKEYDRNYTLTFTERPAKQPIY